MDNKLTKREINKNGIRECEKSKMYSKFRSSVKFSMIFDFLIQRISRFNPLFNLISIIYLPLDFEEKIENIFNPRPLWFKTLTSTTINTSK